MIIFLLAALYFITSLIALFAAVHLEGSSSPSTGAVVAWVSHADINPTRIDGNQKITKEPPPHVEFDLHGSTLIVQHFMKYCNPPARDAHTPHPRDSPFHKMFQWQREPACRILAEHPTVVSAARRVMGLSSDAPVYLHTVQRIIKQAGDIQRLHSNLESDNTRGCRRNDATTVWIILASECAQGPSPLTLVSGSHKILTAQDELIKRRCWSKSYKTELPCNVTHMLEEVVASDGTLAILAGPSHPLMGIAWPTTAWHETRDTCTREAVSIRYAASRSCARSLAYRSPGKEIGQITIYPDKLPFLQLGGHEPETLDPDYPLDFLHRLPSTGKANERCIESPSPPEDSFQNSFAVNNSIHISGKINVTKKWGRHIGVSKQPKENPVKSKLFLLANVGKTFYDSKKRHRIAHKPHNEKTLEICAVIKGALNVALGASCDDYYDVMSLRASQVTVLFPEIYHTNSPDSREDGEHICFKILPMQNRNNTNAQYNKAAALAASRRATKYLQVDLKRHFEFDKNRALDIYYEENPSNLPPGYNRLHVKMVQYKKDEQMKVHVDAYDLIVLTIFGSITIQSSHNTTLVLPEHQYALVPAGVSHGFKATYGPARLLFIEIS